MSLSLFLPTYTLLCLKLYYNRPPTPVQHTPSLSISIPVCVQWNYKQRQQRGIERKGMAGGVGRRRNLGWKQGMGIYQDPPPPAFPSCLSQQYIAEHTYSQSPSLSFYLSLL